MTACHQPFQSTSNNGLQLSQKLVLGGDRVIRYMRVTVGRPKSSYSIALGKMIINGSTLWTAPVNSNSLSSNNAFAMLAHFAKFHTVQKFLATDPSIKPIGKNFHFLFRC